MAKLKLKPKSLKVGTKVQTQISVHKKSELIEVLIKARKRLGVSQADLAALSNLTRQSISEIERGKVDPSLSHTLELLRLCGINVKLEVHLEAENGKE